MRGRAWARRQSRGLYVVLLHACPLLALALPPFGNFTFYLRGPGAQLGPSYTVSPDPRTREVTTHVATRCEVTYLTMDLAVDPYPLEMLSNMLPVSTASCRHALP